MQWAVFLKNLGLVAHICVRHNRVMLGFFVLIEELVLENQNGNYTNGNSHISHIEYRSEKLKLFTTYNRDPCWIVRIGDNGEIQHVYHFPMKQPGIATASG